MQLFKPKSSDRWNETPDSRKKVFFFFLFKFIQLQVCRIMKLKIYSKYLSMLILFVDFFPNV